jgi:hypothetical protein
VSYANDTLRTDELDELVRYGSLAVALGVSLEVAQVADVAVLIRWGAMLLIKRVDCYPLEPQGTALATGETNSVDQRTCSRWYYRQRRGRGCLARRWHRYQ